MSANVFVGEECDWLGRVIEMRRRRPVRTEFLQADLVDEVNGTNQEIVWRAVALHSHCAPDSVPSSFYWHRGQRPIFELLDHDVPDASPQERLFLNMHRAVKALQAGELAPAWKGFDLRPSYNTVVDLEVFREWARRVGLPVVGPWAVRGESVARPIGYVAQFAARPHNADAMEALDKKFGDELAAGCPHGHDAMKRFCIEACGLTATAAARLVAEMDPRPERRGRPAGE